MWGVDMEVPLKKAQPEPSPGQVSDLPTHVIELRTLTPTEVRAGLTARSTFVGPWLLKPARMSLLAVMNSWNVASADAVVAPEARSAAPSFWPIMTAGRSSSKPAVRAIAMGSPATLLTMSTAIAPAVLAFATFWLNVQFPRLMIASSPDTPAGTLVHPSEALSKKLKGEAPGRASKSPTAAPTVVPPPAGYVKGWPTTCWFVLAPTAISLRARPGDSTVPPPGPLLPAATATVTPASTALSRPIAKRSLLPWYPPPSDRLRTSIPSAIAASTALRMSSLRAFVTSPGNTL